MPDILLNPVGLDWSPGDWYWLAADGRLYASGRAAIVATSDAAYTAWAGARGHGASAWPSELAGGQTAAALQSELMRWGLSLPASLLPPPSVSELVAYAEARQAALMAGGFAFDVAASGQPAEVVQADTDLSGRLNLAGLVSLAQINASFTSIWVQAGGGLTLTASEIIALGVAVGTFVEQTYQALATVLANIASGVITTTAQIDAAAWPAASGALAATANTGGAQTSAGSAPPASTTSGGATTSGATAS